jgi:hypothetical protein
VALTRARQVLNLPTNNLHGPLPSSLANLRDLRVLRLSYNRLDSKFPRELYSVSRDGGRADPCVT